MNNLINVFTAQYELVIFFWLAKGRFSPLLEGFAGSSPVIFHLL